MVLAAGIPLLLFCGEKPSKPTPLPEPANLRLEQLDAATVRLSWTEVSAATAYEVFMRESTQDYYVKPAARLAAPASSYTFTDIPAGASYFFGVQALGRTDTECSRLVYSEMLTIPAKEPDPGVDPGPDPDPNQPSFTVSQTFASSAYIGIKYKISKLTDSRAAHGICFAAGKEPTVEDGVIPGPDLSVTPELLQLVPATLLEYGKSFTVRPYAVVSGKTYYGPSSSLSLGQEPAPVTLTWTRLSTPELPSGIEIYETTSPLNGRNFHAWYAIADCTGEVEFRVQYPSAIATIENQFSEDCLVLVNGAVFGPRSGKSLGTVITGGTRSAWRDEVDGQYWGNGKLMNITRATFGVDAAGHPATCWSGLPDADHIWFYDRPLTTVAGEAPFPACTATNPAPALSWTPQYALAAGPMLLHGGICPTDLSQSSSGFYMTNYELWANDIYATCPDRTAVGYTSDGRIILFICDGRIASSQGAYVTEVAAILRSLGCVGAVNLDGGGSTGMMVRGCGHIGDLTDEASRKVCTTLGFFRKN